MKIYENKKIVTNYACYCSTTVLTSKIIKEQGQPRRPLFVGLGGKYLRHTLHKSQLHCSGIMPR